MATKLSTLSLNTDNASKISENAQKSQKFKVLLLGEKKVGKTAIINRFVKNEFKSSYKMTVGAAQTNFQCEVPIDLIEEIPEDKNLIRSMTSFLREVNENDEVTAMIDEINTEKESETVEEHPTQQSSSTIVDYGQWTKPEISQDEITNTQKTSISLQISLEIIDIGFHSFNDNSLFENINSIILVCDYTQKNSFIECVEKYKIFLKNINIQKQEYIPVIVAINKSDFKKVDREIKKKEVKKLIEEKLRPIIDKNFFTKRSKQNTLMVLGKNKKHKNDLNSTLLQPPNIEFLFDDDGTADDMDDIDDEKEQKEEIDIEKKAKIRKTDIRYIDVIPCSAKSGKNVETLFGNCIKKTLPTKLQQSVTTGHARTKTTAHVTAPIWLRKVFDDMENNSTSQLIAFGDDETAVNQVDDNFDFIDDD